MSMNWRATVWIGDLDLSMDEHVLREAFDILGEPLCAVKIVRKKDESHCYGFLEFPDEDTAYRVLHHYNGKYIPNCNWKRFKLNTASYGRDESNQTPTFYAFVSDLSPEVDDYILFDAFSKRYKTVKVAKVMRDAAGTSKGYGFVKIVDKSEYEAALVEMQNAVVGLKRVKISSAQDRSVTMPNAQPSQEEQQWQQQYPGYDYQSYYAAWQNYQAQNPYGYGYDQRYGAYGGYSYPQQYAAYTDTQPVTNDAPPSPSQSSSQYGTSYEATENSIEEHDVPLDIDQINQELMQRNEELYTALDDSRWLSVDNLDPPLIKIK